MNIEKTNKENISSTMLKIRSVYSCLSESEQKIVDYIKNNLTEIIHLTVKELALNTDTSVATVIRTTRKLGYKGFSDFKITLAQEIVTPIRSINAEINEEVTEDDDCILVLDKIYNGYLKTIDLTRKVIDADELKKAAEAILTANKVAIFGVGGSSGSVAADANHKFMRIGINTNYYSDTHIQSVQAAFLTEGDVAIGISHSGASKDVVEALEIANRNGATTISITNFNKSPLTEVAKIKLFTASQETKYRILAQASRIAELGIIDALYTYVAFKKKDAAVNGIRKVMEAVKNKKF